MSSSPLSPPSPSPTSEGGAEEKVVDALVEELFSAKELPATNHQEWLLRMFSHLMDREAHVVSVAEERERRLAGRKRRGGGTA